MAHAPDAAWKRRSCGECAKGPRLFDWAVAELPVYDDTTAPGWQRWLLVRRSLTRNSKGEYEPAYYLCCVPTTTTDDELIRVAGVGWAIEDCFQTAKTEVGLGSIAWLLSTLAVFHVHQDGNPAGAQQPEEAGATWPG